MKKLTILAFIALSLFAAQTDEQSREPDPDLRPLPLGSLISKVSTNERSAGDRIEAE